jgi:signal transduction histidine kinase/putative methionine-R-sulfoxide reductase with GAF domain
VEGKQTYVALKETSAPGRDEMNAKANAFQHENEQANERNLAAMYQAGLVSGMLDLPKLLQSTVESASQLLGADVVTLYQFDQSTSQFVPPAAAVGVSEQFWSRPMPSTDGSAAKIARLGDVIIANDARSHPDISKGFIEAENIVSSAGFPLKVESDIVGVLFLNYHCPHLFTQKDINRVTIFANMAAIAIHNADLLRQQDAATRRLQMLQQGQEAINSVTELDEVLRKILSEGLRIVDTSRGTLMLLKKGRLVPKAQFGPRADDPKHKPKSFKLGEGIAGVVAATGEAMLCRDVLEEPLFRSSPDRELTFRSLLTVPIMSSEGRVIGVISADDPELGHFDESHRQLLSDMAGQFASAIERIMLLETLSALHKVFERITAKAISTRELPPVLDEIAKNATEVLEIDVITIYQYDQQSDEFIVPPLMKGIRHKRRMQTEVFKHEAPSILVRNLKRHHYAPNSEQDKIMNPDCPEGGGPGFVVREGIKSSAGLLLKVRDETVGVLFVNYRFSHRFLKREKQIIEAFANGAAIAIQDARQWETLKRTQDTLIQTAKMSALGNLAAGIAHELKNPLANILIPVNTIERGYIEGEAIPQILARAKAEVRRASDIIDSLLDFARPRAADRSSVDILALLNETLGLLQNQALLNHVEIESRLQPIPSIQGIAPLLKQVLFNIVRNALDAMPKGGKLILGTSSDEHNVRISVQDTGPGIPESVRPHLFVPFVTSKDPGKGVGLGLAISYSIVRDHKGDILVSSEEGKGSTFVVILPLGE